MVDGSWQPTTGETVRRQVDALRGLVAELHPDAIALPEAAGLWDDFDRIERLAGAAEMLLARRVEESPTWQQAGCRSAAEYLARTSGSAVRATRELLRASKCLGRLPTVDAAVRGGRLSVTQAKLITDAAAVDATKTEQLVAVAGRLSLAELAQECGRTKAAADPNPEETYRRIHANRRLRQRTDAEGAWCLHTRGTPDDGALVNFALEPLIDEIYDQARREGRHEHRDAYAYDAFVELVRRFIDLGDRPGGPATGAGGNLSSAANGDRDGPDSPDSEHPDANAPRQWSRRNPRYMALCASTCRPSYAAMSRTESCARSPDWDRCR